MLTREAILLIDDAERVVVNVPQWGGEVYVRCMTGAERDKLEALFVNAKAKGESVPANFRAYLAALTVCDEKGELVFNVADVELLAKKSAAALDKIADVAMKLNKLRNEDVEELTKN